MVLRSYGRGRPLNAPAESGESPTADDFRAVYSVAEWRMPPEDIVAQPSNIVTVAERPAPREDIAAQPSKVVVLLDQSGDLTDFDTTRFLYRMR